MLYKGKEIPLTGEKAEQVVADPKFQNWLASLDAEFEVEAIDVKAATFVGGKLLFAYLDCKVFDSEGQWVPGLVFMRGDAAAVLVVIIDNDGFKWTVLTRQSRFPAGKHKQMLEIPAGMLDRMTGEFKGVAAKELEEETGLKVTEADYFNKLGEVYLSPGGSDEKIGLYVAVFHMSNQKIAELSSQVAGTDEGENISLVVVPLHRIPRVAGNDAKTLVAYYLFSDDGR